MTEPLKRTYARAYHDLTASVIWPDDLALAGYYRLLNTADRAWPTPTSTYGINPALLDTLVAAGLVGVEGGIYTITGLNEERELVHERASRAGLASAAQRAHGESGQPASNGGSTPERGELPPMVGALSQKGWDDLNAMVKAQWDFGVPREHRYNLPAGYTREAWQEAVNRVSQLDYVKREPSHVMENILGQLRKAPHPSNGR